MMKLSIVTTLFHSEKFILKFTERLLDSIPNEFLDTELIFVNDGSPDNSSNIVIDLKKNMPFIKLIELSRNFGHHYALQTGLKYSTGDYIFLIDIDLETPPEILLEFYKELTSNEQLDVVYGYQEYRKGAAFERITGILFWKLFNKLSPVKVPSNILTERLMTRQYIDSLLTMNDSNLFLGGMFYWVGFNQLGIPVKKGARESKSTYSFSKKINLMLYAITSFSSKPLEWMFKFGIFVSIISFIFLVIIGLNKLLNVDDVQVGWTSVLASILFVLGILSTFMGLLGIYIGKVYTQVQGRPNVIIKKIYQ